METKYSKEYLIERLDRMQAIYYNYDVACYGAKELSLEEGFRTYETYDFGYNDSKIEFILILYSDIKNGNIDIPLTYDLVLYIYNTVTSVFDNTTFGNFIESVIEDESKIERIKLAFSK